MSGPPTLPAFDTARLTELGRQRQAMSLTDRTHYRSRGSPLDSTLGARGGPEHTRRPTAVEAMSLQAGEEDASRRRLRRTPRVFQSNKDGFSHQWRRELRANLLPSILYAPLETAEGGAQRAAAAAGVEGQHFTKYQAQLAEREVEEAKTAVFMQRGGAFPPSDSDPQYAAAASCTVFRDLVTGGRENDWLEKFRRPQEGLVNNTSGVCFSHEDQALDLAELGSILTLDLERRSSDSRTCGSHVPFLSIQVASRVPLLVRDPVSPEKEVFQSEPMQKNDLHMLRIDLRPGEVRQVAYDLNDADFKASKLAGRMAGLMDPERGALARVARILDGKETETQRTMWALNDVLRGLVSQTEADAGTAEVLGRMEDLVDGETRQSRTWEATVDDTRRSLGRFVETMEQLAQLSQGLVPSMSHVFDRVALVCVRQAERLVVQGRREVERLHRLWEEAEKQRQLLAHIASRHAGTGGQAGGAEQRAVLLKATLARQEEEYSQLLRENEQHQAALSESAATAKAQQDRMKEMKATIAKLQLDNKALREALAKQQSGDLAAAAGAGAAAGAPEPPLVVVDAAAAPAASKPSSKEAAEGPPDASGPVSKSATLPPARSRGDQPMRGSKSVGSKSVGSKAEATGSKGGAAAERSGERVGLSFSVGRAAQTDNDFFFQESAPLPDEMSRFTYDDLVANCGRLFRALGSYEWNSVTNTYLLTAADPTRWADEFAVEAQLKALQAQSKLPPEALRHVSSVSKLGGLASQKVKVERLWQKACVVQLEDEIAMLQKAGRQGFDAWVVGLLREQGSQHAGRLADGLDPGGLWTAVTEMEQSAPHKAKGRRVNKGTVAAPAKGKPDGAAEEVMDLDTLQSELQSIWESLSTFEDAAPVRFVKTSSDQLFQGCIKRFYLLKWGRSKHVESSAVRLCRSVLEHMPENYEVALFAALAGIKPAASMGDAVPQQRNIVRWLSSFSLDTRALNDLPLDAAFCLAAVARELGMVRREQSDAAGGAGVSMHSAVVAALSTIAARCKATSRFFWASFFALIEFPGDGTSTAAEGAGEEPEGSGLGLEGGGEASGREVLYVSYLLAAYVREQAGGAGEPEAEDEEDIIGQLWARVLEDAPQAAPTEGLVRASLNVTTGLSSLEASLAAELVVRHADLQVQPELVASALSAVALGGGAPSGPGSMRAGVQVTGANLERLAGAWRKGGVLRCPEGVLMWAAAWSLAQERAHEMELMGELFQLYDSSGDGWLQFAEFSALIAAMTPQVSQADSEELFLAGAEAFTGDMTKEVFLKLASRMGISADVDLLEHLVDSQRAALGPAA
ncbi:unnamed protein product [Prorocentrum cordatum]|uniref:EF-hand domain-containing protein n=1 Tax=Prorocentrum cordatum TaxID=2364126 RepID=A0ABN9T4G0_9DINO|nr:unnamed protein product [Polarella glacialis]